MSDAGLALGLSDRTTMVGERASRSRRMSARLGAALAEYLRRHLARGQGNFVLVEGVTSDVAEGMSRAWDDSLPRWPSFLLSRTGSVTMR